LCDNSRLPKLRRTLRLITAEGAAYSAMVGIGESYLAAFALALGMSNVVAGLVAVFPMLAGGLLQLATPAGVRRLGGYRAWTVTCAAAQALSFAPLIAAACTERAPPAAVFAASALYWAAGMAAGPSWNAWVGALLPRRIRSSYFGFRQSAMQAAVLLGLVSGGLWLQASDGRPLAFAPLFAAALVTRALSAGILAAHPTVTASPLGVRQSLRWAWSSELRGWMVLVAACHGAVNLAGPFFTPYMLAELRFSYGEFMVLTGTVFAAKTLSLPSLGRLASRVSPGRLSALSGLGIASLPFFWALADSFVALLALQVLSGVVWAAFELGAQLGFIAAATEHERVSLLSAFNLVNALAVTGAALLGGVVLGVLGGDRDAYITLFALSAVARLTVALALSYRVRNQSRTAIIPALRFLAVRPWGGGVMRPITSALPQRSRWSGAEATHVSDQAGEHTSPREPDQLCEHLRSSSSGGSDHVL
jgi:MFS family permease